MITPYRSGVLSFIWGLLNDIQSLVILSLISLNVTGIARLINSAILTFASMNIIPTSMIFSALFVFSDYDSDPVNDYFNQLGYSSSNAIQNMGSAFIYLILNMAALILLVPIILINRKFESSQSL